MLASTPIDALLCFDDTACVVTGAASGIGRAIATRFAEVGAAVTLIDVDPALDRAAAALAAAHPAPVSVVTADVRDAAALDAVAQEAVETRRRLVWVNAAGIFPSSPLEDLTVDEWDRVVGVDLTGTFNGCRAAGLAARRRGRPAVIVNISSVAGFRAGWPPGIAHYVSAKHGVQGLTKAMAVELGPDVRVVCLAPGTVVTEGLEAKFGPLTGGPDDPYIRMARRMPIPRPAIPDDVARLAVACASPLAAMTTGATIPVDAGHLAT